MNAGHSFAYSIFQACVIALVLTWSCWFALRRLLPRRYRALQAGLARRFGHSSNAWLRSFGKYITPQQAASGGGCGSGGGCSSCGTCASTAAPSGDAQPLLFLPRRKP